jgi:hypothetical protein
MIRIEDFIEKLADIEAALAAMQIPVSEEELRTTLYALEELDCDLILEAFDESDSIQAR